jgi:hypothetical protein
MVTWILAIGDVQSVTGNKDGFPLIGSAPRTAAFDEHVSRPMTF